MHPIHLDYQRSYRPVPTLGLILLACALVVAVQTTRQYFYFGRVLAGWEAAEDRADRQALKYGLGRQANPQDQDQAAREVAKANEVLRRITLPWGGLFRAVESATPKDVALLAIEPDADKQRLRIGAEAKDTAAMLDYIRRLETGGTFVSVTLQNHQIQQQDPQRPIRFSLAAAWSEQP